MSVLGSGNAAAASAQGTVAPETVAVQGDSMVASSRPSLRDRLVPAVITSYSARAGRAVGPATTALEHQRLGDVVVFAVGTDATEPAAAYRRDLTRVFGLLGSGRNLVVVTVYSHDRASADDAVIHRFAAAHPGRVTVADWVHTIRSRHLRLRDGAHPATPAGWKAFAGVIASAVNAAAPLPGAAATPSTPAPTALPAPLPSPTPSPTATAAPAPIATPTQTYTVPAENAGPVTLPRVADPAPVPSAASIAWWKADGAAWTAGWHNGQCTELAWEKRPDIVQLVTEDGLDDWVASAYTAPPLDWDATFWDDLAASAGVPVGTLPQPGALMVFNSDDYPAWPGHVASVDAVNADGSFVITEENAPTPGLVTTRTVAPADLVGANIDFVYAIPPRLAAQAGLTS